MHLRGPYIPAQLFLAPRAAWMELKDLDSLEARAAYVSFVDEFFPGWEEVLEDAREGAGEGDSGDDHGEDAEHDQVPDYDAEQDTDGGTSTCQSQTWFFQVIR